MHYKFDLLHCALLTLALALGACGQSKSVHDEQAAGLIPTIYYKPIIHTEDDKCSTADLIDMKDDGGRILASLCRPTYKNCLLQGSCYVLSKGRTKMIGYDSWKETGYTFLEVDYKRCPYGWGVKEICLDPYFSIAADMDYFKAGDVIFVPQLVGVNLPTGETHDGYLIVRDQGGGIIGPARFDFFTGLLDHRSKNNPFARLGLGDPKRRFSFRVVRGEEAERARHARNYPGILESVQNSLNF